jgi:hypothetical protein
MIDTIHAKIVYDGQKLRHIAATPSGPNTESMNPKYGSRRLPIIKVWTCGVSGATLTPQFRQTVDVPVCSAPQFLHTLGMATLFHLRRMSAAKQQAHEAGGECAEDQNGDDEDKV